MKLPVILLFLQLWVNVEVSSSQDVCSRLPDVPHAFVSLDTTKSEYQQGDVIHFTCEPGYTSSQISKYVCMSEGWLAVRQGTCYSCSTLPGVPHAHVSEETKKAEYKEGDMIDFTCDPGYTSGQTSKYACMREGWLAVRQGTCYIAASGCNPPPADGGITIKGLPENDDLIVPDQVITFSCDGPGKYLSGSSLLICGEDGQWNNPFPSCEDTCRVPRELPGLRIINHVPNNQLKVGQNLRLACRSSWLYLRGKDTIECSAGGQWRDPFPTCGAPVGCGTAPALEDGDTRGTSRSEYRHGERIEYVCQNFYTMQGDPHRTCNNGEWTGEMKCLKPCTVNEEVQRNHNIASRYSSEIKLYAPHNDFITFMCTRGTRHDGRVSMRQQCVDGVMNFPTCH